MGWEDIYGDVPEDGLTLSPRQHGLRANVTAILTEKDKSRLIDAQPREVYVNTRRRYADNSVAPLSELNLNFLKGLKSITWLIVAEYDWVDVSAINELHSLERLNIPHYEKAEIDFKGLSHLREMMIPWNKKLAGAEHLVRLESLYAMPLFYDSLKEISKILSLEELAVNLGRLETLDGVERMSKLWRLRLYYLRRFEDLSGIAQAPQITELELYNLPKLESIEGLRNHPGLEKITITYLKNLKSISVLKTCPNLKEANISRIPAVPQHEREWAEAKFGKSWRLP